MPFQVEELSIELINALAPLMPRINVAILWKMTRG